ncbi:MAG: hypothetical protein ACN2B6_01085 [Rickettsiales bacterium]
MSFYTRMEATALSLLTRRGVQYTFTHKAQGAYDPATGANAVTISTYDKYVVRDTFGLFEQNNTSVEQGDIRAIAESGSYTVGDTLEMNSETWRIINVDPITPGATNVANILQLRKGG